MSNHNKTKDEIEQTAEQVVDAILVNWNVTLIKDGIKRMVNRL